MEYRQIENTDVKVSKVGIGTWQFGQTSGWGPAEITELERVISLAIDSGVNLIDTAAAYGESEEILGKLLKGRRNKVLLATKIVGNKFDYETMKSAIGASLKKLQTDYVDLYQIHWPKLHIPDTWHTQDMEKKDYEDIFDSMSRLKKEGLIRFAGISNFRLYHVREFSSQALDFLVTNQAPYSLLWRFYDARGVSDLCKEHGILLLAYSPLAQGLLTGRFGKDGEQVKTEIRKANVLFNEPLYTRALDVVEEVKKIAAEIDAAPSQVALKWAMERDCMLSVLAGMRTLRHAESNIAAVNIPLTEEHQEKLDQASLAFQETLPEWMELWVRDNEKQVIESLGIPW